MVDDRPIARLRRVAEALERLEAPAPDDAAWFVGATSRYEAARRSGVELDMDAALGLGQPGRVGWWTDELRERRDALLREIHARHFARLSVGQAAVAIGHLARTVERIGLKQSLALGDGRLELIAEAFSTGQPIPGPRQIKRVLQLDMKEANSFPVAVSTLETAASPG